MKNRNKPHFFHFSELSVSNINRDFQVHTNWTDGEEDIETVLARASEVGLAELAFTEHARATSSYYTEFFKEIDDRSKTVPNINIYRGFEVRVINEDGQLDISDDMSNVADIVLGSVHSFPTKNGRIAPAKMFDKLEAYEIEYNLAKGIIEGNMADVLSHAGGMCLRNFENFPLELLEELIKIAANCNVAFEINTSYHELIFEQLLVLLSKHDPKVSIGSDVHKLSELGHCRDLLQRHLFS